MTDAIVTNRLTKFYSKRKVVDNLTFRVPQGVVYGLLGRNGTGKSTTIKMLLGMVHPDYGSSQLLGEDSENLPPKTRGRIAYLAEGHPLYDWMTIGGITSFTLAFYPSANRQFVDQALDHFQLSKKTKIRRLSKGQRAQVSLVLALASDPELLILDDPTLGLDTNTRRDFLESMIHMIQKRGRTILFSSHILGDVERVADRVGVLVDGVLRVDCPLDHFKRSVCKVVAEFSRVPAASLSAPGLLSDIQIGNRREMVFVGFTNGQRQEIEKLEPTHIDVVEMNLEDAFVAYTRGQRPPLPILMGGGDD